MSDVLVVGYGNTLRSDDGVGPLAAHVVAADPRLAQADVLVCHQLTPEIALDMRGAALVVLIDATTTAPPGAVTIRELGGAGATAGTTAGGAGAGRGPTTHHVGAEALLALSRDLYGAAPAAFVVSVGFADLDPGEGLTSAVEAALPAVADAVARLVAAHRARAGGGPGPA